MALPYTLTNGTLADATQVMANFNYVNPSIFQVYTGTGFNSTISGNNHQEVSYELTAIPAASLTNKAYVRIKITGTSLANCYTNSIAYVQLKIQAKETGGAYADDFSYKYLNYHYDSAASTPYNTYTFEWLHTLTAGQIANGCQFKIFTDSYSNHASGSASFTNVQTVVEVIGG